MPDREFKIKITGDASGIAAESTRAAEGLKSVGTSGEEAGKKIFGGTDKGIGGLKGLANVMRGLRLEFPLFGRAAEMMMNPLVAAIGGAVAIFGYFRAEMAKNNAEMEAVAEAAAKPEIAFRDMAAAAEAVAIQDGKLSESFNTTRTAATNLKNAISDQTDALRVLQETQAALDDANKAEELADVHQAMKRRELNPLDPKGISASEGARRQAGINAKYEDIARKRKEENAAADLALKKGALDQAAALELQKEDEAARALEAKVAADEKLAEVERRKARFERGGEDMQSPAERDAAAGLDKAQKTQDGGTWGWRTMLEDFGLYPSREGFGNGRLTPRPNKRGMWPAPAIAWGRRKRKATITGQIIRRRHSHARGPLPMHSAQGRSCRAHRAR
jgi:hypothetical protein